VTRLYSLAHGGDTIWVLQQLGAGELSAAPAEPPILSDAWDSEVALLPADLGMQVVESRGYRWITMQVRVRVIPSTTWMRDTTSRPS
jgi:hypothetical protein